MQNNDAIEVNLVLNSPLKTIWDAITKPEIMAKWYFKVQGFELKQRCEFYFYEPNGENFKHVCKILEIDPMRRLRHTWTYPEISKGVSIVSWDLFKEGSYTRIRLRHQGVENFKDGSDALAVESFEAGWEEIVKKSLPDYLKSTLFDH
ncbi:SRPBCC family protein [Galbibacter sp.]|uniref:SRPBCC family protein n=1 Tax=Galbibacter sp. TaxID=2918471 RepID=UPI003A945C9B